MKTKKFLILTIVFCCSINLFSDYGRTILPVLLETRSVRSVSLGKTFISDNKNVSSVFENSVSLCYIDSPQIYVFYNKSFADVGLGYLSFVYPLKKISFGIGLLNLQTDTFEVIITKTGENEEFVEERYFVKGLNDWVYILGTGVALSSRTSFGFNVKYYVSNLVEKYTMQGFCFDTGIVFTDIGNFNFGISLNNIGSDNSYFGNGESEKFKLPMYIQTGVTWKTKNEKFYHNFSISMEYEIRVNEKVNIFHTGFEWCLPSSWIHPLNDVSLRIGYLTDRKIDSRLSYGFGLEISSLVIDYSFVPHDKLGISHYISVTYKFPVILGPVEEPEEEQEEIDVDYEEQ